MTPNAWTAVVFLGPEQTDMDEAVSSLRSEGLDVRTHSAEAAADEIEAHPPALAVVCTPVLSVDALELLRTLKRLNVPSIVCKANLTEDEELILLHGGAWEVVDLPMSSRRLRARIASLHQNITSRSNGSTEAIHDIENVSINLRRHEVTVSGAPIPLTKTEFDLLVALARDPHAVLSRDELLHDAGAHGAIGPRSLESHLSRLRLKIRSAGGPRLVESVRGVGYRLTS